MNTLKKINPNNRNIVPGIGQDKNIFVKSGDVNPVIDQVNTNTSILEKTMKIPSATQQALSGAGAIAVTSYCTAWTSTATGNALTLAAGQYLGQIKKIRYVAEAAGADTGVLTPSVTTGFATCTFNAVGDYAVFQYNGSYWICIENSGCTLA